ncbi:MAG: PLD nuclease N-terminal domain-containing protein [Flavobacterium sp.]|nr:PLD nuclease N-terminal domain-containing protein [Flavobacterium sp.]
MEILQPNWGLSAWSFSSLIAFILWAYCLIDILRSHFKGSNDKLIWILVVLLIPCLGGFLYLIIGRKQRI